MNELERSVSRFVDGEMGRDEQVAFEARLRDDEALRQKVADLRGLRDLFGPERAAAGPRPPADFRARVLAAAATDGEREAAARVDEVEQWAKHVVWAAAILIAAVTVLAVGVLRRVDSGRLEASEDEVRRTIDALDAKIDAQFGRTEESTEDR